MELGQGASSLIEKSFELGENITQGDFCDIINNKAYSSQFLKNVAILNDTDFRSEDYDLCSISSSAIFICYRDSADNVIKANIITISNDVGTFNTEYSLSDTNVVHLQCSLIDSTHILIIYENVSGNIEGVIATISGTTITFGTPQQLLTTAYIQYVKKGLINDGSNKFVLYYADASSYPSLVVITISGSTINVGTPVVVVSYNSVINVNDVCLLDTDKVCATYKMSDNYPYVVVATISGTTITLGTPITLNSIATSYMNIVKNTTTSVFVNTSATSATKIYTFRLDISGTTITNTANTQITSPANATLIYLLLKETDIILTGYNDALYNLVFNGYYCPSTIFRTYINRTLYKNTTSSQNTYAIRNNFNNLIQNIGINTSGYAYRYMNIYKINTVAYDRLNNFMLLEETGTTGQTKKFLISGEKKMSNIGATISGNGYTKDLTQATTSATKRLIKTADQTYYLKPYWEVDN